MLYDVFRTSQSILQDPSSFLVESLDLVVTLLFKSTLFYPSIQMNKIGVNNWFQAWTIDELLLHSVCLTLTNDGLLYKTGLSSINV